MNITDFRRLITPVTDFIADQPLGPALADALKLQFPPDGYCFNAIETACHAAIAAGWMCAQGTAGRRFGRVIEASDATAGLSIDVVDLTNIAGPHHHHPLGEICMIIPLSKGAQFDGRDRGWWVYPPQSAHRPTVTDGEALILYMLPGGKIEFTEAPQTQQEL
ncbi:MAG: DUF4863 family protein [Halopseudomonas sp.]